MEYLFCTRQDVKRFANTSASLTTYDDLIDDLIRQWTLTAKKFCRRDFIYGTHTETFSVFGIGDVLVVKLLEAPLTIDEINPLMITCEGETLPEEAYMVDKEKGLLRIDTDYLVQGTDNLVVTYSGGLSTENYDDQDSDIMVIEKCPLRTAIANQCAYALIRTIQANQGQQSANSGKGATNTMPASMGFLPEVSLVLSNYRITLTGK